jgi:hypothetical protein
MKYELPDEDTLGKYMHLLYAVLLATRSSADPELAQLGYAVHNLPDLLLRWSDMVQGEQLAALQRFETDHPRWAGHFTGILEGAPSVDWQNRWTK